MRASTPVSSVPHFGWREDTWRLSGTSHSVLSSCSSDAPRSTRSPSKSRCRQRRSTSSFAVPATPRSADLRSSRLEVSEQLRIELSAIFLQHGLHRAHERPPLVVGEPYHLVLDGIELGHDLGVLR